MENVGKGASTLFEFSFFGLFDVTITETAVSAFVVMILLLSLIHIPESSESANSTTRAYSVDQIAQIL